MDAAREVDALHVKVQPYLVGAGVFASACIWLDILRSRWRAVLGDRVCMGRQGVERVKK